MVLYIVIGIVVLLIIYLLVMYNIFIKAANKVDEAFSTMDVYLKKRWELIPNLVEAVKGYSKHEADTLKEVIKNRSYNEMSNNEKIETNQKVSSELFSIMALAEAYPDLKASVNFKDLSEKLTKVEDDIAYSRKYYNGTVRQYNNKIQMFPNNLAAMIFGYKSKKMYEALDSERQNVKVEL